MKPKGDGWETDDIEDPPPDGVLGNVSGAESDVAQGIVDLSAEVFKLVIYVREASEAEFKRLAPRLALFRNMVNQIPTEATPDKPIGFKVKAKKGKR